MEIHPVLLLFEYHADVAVSAQLLGARHYGSEHAAWQQGCLATETGWLVAARTGELQPSL